MAQNLAINNSGATPFTFPGMTPAKYTLGLGGLTPTASTATASPKQSPAVLPPPPKPPSPPTNQDVKSHTVSSDGSVTQTYHPTTSGLLPSAPAKPTPTQASQANTAGETITDVNGNQGVAKFNSMTGQSLTPSSTDPTSPATPSTTPPAAPSNPVIDPKTGQATFPGLIAGLANVGTQGDPQVQKYTDDIANIEKQNANTQADIAANQNLSGSVANGRSAIATNLNTGKLNAAQSGLTNALSGQGQEISALNSAGGLAAPVTTPGLFSPQSGNAVNPQVVGNAVQQAINLVNNGTPVTDPTVQSLLSPFGFVGTNALVDAEQSMNGGKFNPTAQSTSANTNSQIGSQFQKQAATLDNSLKQFSNIGSIASNFLQSNKLINPNGLPAINGAISSYIGTLGNPAALKDYQLIMNDASALQQAVIGSYGNSTPTGDEAKTLSTDPTTLDAAGLSSWLNTLTQLGGSQLSSLQGSSSDAYNSSGSYSGAPTTANTATPTVAAPNTAITPVQGAQAASGEGLNILGGIEGLFGKVVGSAAQLFGEL